MEWSILFRQVQILLFERLNVFQSSIICQKILMKDFQPSEVEFLDPL